MKDHIVFAGVSALAFILLALTVCTTEVSILIADLSMHDSVSNACMRM